MATTSGHVSVFCDGTASPAEHAAALAALAAATRGGELSLLSLVRDMDAHLTNTETGHRARAVLLLAEARGLSAVPLRSLTRRSPLASTQLLPSADVSSTGPTLAVFFASKLGDWRVSPPLTSRLNSTSYPLRRPCLRGALRGCAHLLSLPGCLSSSDAAALGSRLLSEVHSPSLVAPERRLALDCLASLATHSSGAAARLIGVAQLVDGCVAAVDSERDPRCLASAFALWPRISAVAAAASPPVTLGGDAFDALACYWPLVFTPPPPGANPLGPSEPVHTRASLAASLRAALTCCPSFGPKAVPLFLGPLAVPSDQPGEAVGDACACIVSACAAFDATACVVPHAHAVWRAAVAVSLLPPPPRDAVSHPRRCETDSGDEEAEDAFPDIDSEGSSDSRGGALAASAAAMLRALHACAPPAAAAAARADTLGDAWTTEAVALAAAMREEGGSDAAASPAASAAASGDDTASKRAAAMHTVGAAASLIGAVASASAASSRHVSAAALPLDALRAATRDASTAAAGSPGLLSLCRSLTRGALSASGLAPPSASVSSSVLGPGVCTAMAELCVASLSAARLSPASSADAADVLASLVLLAFGGKEEKEEQEGEVAAGGRAALLGLVSAAVACSPLQSDAAMQGDARGGVRAACRAALHRIASSSSSASASASAASSSAPSPASQIASPAAPQLIRVAVPLLLFHATHAGGGGGGRGGGGGGGIGGDAAPVAARAACGALSALASGCAPVASAAAAQLAAPVAASLRAAVSAQSGDGAPQIASLAVQARCLVALLTHASPAPDAAAAASAAARGFVAPFLSHGAGDGARSARGGDIIGSRGPISAPLGRVLSLSARGAGAACAGIDADAIGAACVAALSRILHSFDHDTPSSPPPPPSLSSIAASSNDTAAFLVACRALEALPRGALEAAAGRDPSPLVTALVRLACGPPLRHAPPVCSTIASAAVAAAAAVANKHAAGGEAAAAACLPPLTRALLPRRPSSDGLTAVDAGGAAPMHDAAAGDAPPPPPPLPAPLAAAKAFRSLCRALALRGAPSAWDWTDAAVSILRAAPLPPLAPAGDDEDAAFAVIASAFGATLSPLPPPSQPAHSDGGGGGDGDGGTDAPPHAKAAPLWRQRSFTGSLDRLRASLGEHAASLHRGSPPPKWLLIAVCHVVASAPPSPLAASSATVAQLLPPALCAAADDAVAAAAAAAATAAAPEEAAAARRLLCRALSAGVTSLFVDPAGASAAADRAAPLLACLCRLAGAPSPPAARRVALQGLTAAVELPFASTFPSRKAVMKCLASAVDDPRRAVRAAAVTARAVWAATPDASAS